MKFLAVILLSSISIQASAVSLVAETICKGRIEGKNIIVLGLVNPNNWCETPENDQNSAILIKEGSNISVYTSVTTKVQGSDDVTMTLLSTEGLVNLTYKIERVPGRGAGKLEIVEIEGTDSQSVELRCEFPELHMDC